MKPQALIFCFTWHVGNQKFCETTDRFREDRNSRKLSSTFSGSCTLGAFADTLATKITSAPERASLVCVTTTGSNNHVSTLHTQLLADKLGGISYLKHSHETVRNGSGKYVASSIFVRSDLVPAYQQGNAMMSKKLGNNYSRTFSYSNSDKVLAAAVATYVKHPRYGSTAIVSANIRVTPKVLPDQMKMEIDTCMNSMINKLCRGSPKPDRYIIMGDLGSEIMNLHDYQSISDMHSHDIIGNYIKHNSISNPSDPDHVLSEGVDNRGPTFPPTGDIKMDHGARVALVQDTYVRDNYTSTSWSDRVLIGSNATNSKPDKKLHQVCARYEAFDDHSMRGSPRCAVTAFISLRRKKKKD